VSGNLKKVLKALEKAKIKGVEATEWRKSVILEGKVSSYEEKIKAGYAAVGKDYKGVVNDIEVIGLKDDKMSIPSISDNLIDGKSFDIVIIGGGVIGCSIARELSKFDIKIALLEKEEDLAKHASSRNDGMIHPVIAPKPGTKKAIYNLRGNIAYTKICDELKVEFKRTGNLILYRNPFSKLLTPILMVRAKKNGESGYKYLNKEAIKKMEPYVSPEQHGGFYLPSAGILSPYKLTIAFAENSIENGVEIFLNTVVLGFEMDKSVITKIKTNRGTINAGVVVNASGVWSDVIASFANDRFFSIHPRKGMDAILDVKTGKYQNTIAALVAFSQMSSKTKGGGVVPAIEGNLLVGPTAEEYPYREDYSTDAKSMEYLIEKLKVNTRLQKSDIITYFAGTRACTYEEDFIIEPSEYVDNLVHSAGIQSPGLASAPAIAEDIAKMCIDILKKKKDVKPNQSFNPYRKAIPNLNLVSIDERAKLIKENPAYGRIVCRCEAISEGEIIDALHSPIPVTTIDGVKRRTRAGTGRCQGGFCSPRVMEIISNVTNIPITGICKKGEGSQILIGETKGEVDYSKKVVKTMKSEE